MRVQYGDEKNAEANCKREDAMTTLPWKRDAYDGEEEPFSKTWSMEEGTPRIETRLRRNFLHLPKEIQEASGIVVYGRRIKSLISTTDVAVIKNCDADAVMCVYPFTAQRAVTAAVIHAAPMPVFCGSGGGVTKGERAVYFAMDAENQGATGVVFNAPISNEDLRMAARALDIPIVITVTTESTDVAQRIASGASILHVAGGAKTARIVARIREELPQVPIMATGGKNPENIRATIEAGANAIVYTPPSCAELYREIMDGYREE